ncbi:DUF2064 domain-containing protein [Wenzhouxiangella sp. XN24]|uniref:TIGR04282 family arsenosugar biosynthesis glycosyltransferase n=1 Tax=Wenzhouxiangella sp. XN24 TaxID=2713569 RepID=UPI0013EB48D4|nr:DUF2064 domain-containing protein [Wenzhouxiangella sp. XN24]NGX15274.1 DUF2064 domain-containing protein [Wenzhouxiangella sp. XN24]
MNGGVAIFVKTPGFSPVKTRLAARLGHAEAARWHRLAAAAVASVAAGLHGLTAYWAVAEADPEAHDAWSGLPRLAQGDGPLGARMGRVHAELVARHDYALLLGADTPQLDAADLRIAMEWLAAEAPRMVMGRARDGGFWMLGGNRQPAAAAWTEPPCGCHDTADGFREAMAACGAWRELPLLTDVDELTDLSAMLAEMARLEQPTRAQRQLSDRTRAALARLG